MSSFKYIYIYISVTTTFTSYNIYTSLTLYRNQVNKDKNGNAHLLAPID